MAWLGTGALNEPPSMMSPSRLRPILFRIWLPEEMPGKKRLVECVVGFSYIEACIEIQEYPISVLI